MTMMAKGRTAFGEMTQMLLRQGVRHTNAVVAWSALLIAVMATASSISAQGSRKDDIVFGPSGHPIAGATVRVCQATATGSPCSPLATLYTDLTLTTTAANPLQADGIGNYHFYASAGRYLIQITGPGITGTLTYPDVILAPDVSTTDTGNNISAFGLSLGGNLSVAGNATVSGTLTTSNFSPGSFTPLSLSVQGNASFAGPRPYIDVTAPPYNADPTGASDSTAAIAAAISFACSYNPNNVPAVYFPYTNNIYMISQPQSGTSAIFTTCNGLDLVGGAGNTQQGAQFKRAPQVAILVAHPGSSPTNAPVFLVNNNHGVSFENLTISGYNEAVEVENSANIAFKNTCLTNNSSATGQANNAALYMLDALQFFYFDGGCIQSGGPQTVIMQNDNAGTPISLVFFHDTEISGDGIDFLTTRAGPTGGAGNMTFDNVVDEDCNAPFMSINDTSGSGAMIGFGALTLNHVVMADCSAPYPLLQFNAPGDFLTGVNIIYPQGPSSGAPAIKFVAGSYSGFIHITGCFFSCTTAAVDNSGDTLNGVVVDNFYGQDYQVSAADPNTLRSDSPGGIGAPLRLFPAGQSYATVGLDPTEGLLFNQGKTFGYSGGVVQKSPNTLGLEFPTVVAPTGVTATAAAGGSLPNGTYYVTVYSNTGGFSCSGGTFSAPSFPVVPVALSGSNGTINVNWALPSPNQATNFCAIAFGSATPGQGNAPANFVNSSSGTSVSITSTALTTDPEQFPITPMSEYHRFTYNSLGVNTTSPAYNLDVNGSAAVNSLNGVQKAERFAGADAGIQINACLTAAAASAGVCDARGLTGTYTATHHISIPAHTSLLWCQGKLTISDTGTHDAVELAGDGAAMYGCGESGSGTVPRPQTSGYIACGIAGCTDVDNPSAGTANVDWIHIDKMYLQANGASSTVLNLTSVGHADIENNRFVLGTGGGSFGVYGNTSTGNEDSTNSLVKHNEFDAQSENDTCLSLAGVFNSIKVEQNSCYLPAENTGTIGFALAKDSNGNYPDNDEFDANDCEAATTSFGQICFNLVGAQNVQIGPTNRCENVYNCIQFPSDGSAVGNHMIDPYLSLSVNTMVKPNEPAAAQQAMDNTGTNWQPSFHYGLNDLGGTNLLANPGFEGWTNSTTLYGWGGASGTNINQAGSGIYSQQQSGSAPTDSSTQGSYNVKIGDGATAGLGIHSGCIQVDPTMNYTLAFRIAATSTSVKFRPGFRFYSDPNCTEADRITSVSTNARVLQPSFYAGTSALAGTGANWQSTNASLTYNNGITCNCNVTGADWNVATASAWTPTRNYAITFRVPNAFSSSSTIAQSMRVLVLENTAANPNQIFVDDIALSQGPVNTRVPHTASVTENGACVGCGINTVSNYSMGTVTAGDAPGSANQVDVSVIYLPNVSFSHVTVDVSTLDSSTSDFYSWAITDTAGNVKCSMSSAVNLTATGTNQQTCSQGTVTLANGTYIFAFTGNATTAKIAYSGTAPLALSTAVSTSTSSSGAMSFPIGMPTAGQTFSSYGLPAILLN